MDQPQAPPVEIAAFGKISVGKSALLNAVFDTQAFAVDVRGGSTRAVHRHTVRFAGQEVVVLDTPGIGEVGGAERAAAAEEAARRAGLVLVVLDHDPTAFEYHAVTDLAKFGKPMLVVFNKADALSAPQRAALLEQIRTRLKEHVHPANVLVCAAHPLRHVVRELTDGSLEEFSERSPPDVLHVRERLEAVLREECHFLVQLNEASQAAAKRAAELPERRRQADTLIERYALGIAVGVAANPIPLFDLFGGSAAVGVLVAHLAQVYGVKISNAEVTELARKLVLEGWKDLWPATLPLVGGALLKAVPVVGWMVSALGQGVGAYYLTYVIGQTCSEYFANDRQWAGSLRETLESIIARTDRASLSRQAAEKIKEKIR